MTSDAPAVPIYEIKITLRAIEPEPWRRVQVRADIPLSTLHRVIQHAMGWTNSHLHVFEVRGQRYGMRFPGDDLDFEPPTDERRVRLCDVAGPRMRLVYRLRNPAHAGTRFRSSSVRGFRSMSVSDSGVPRYEIPEFVGI